MSRDKGWELFLILCRHAKTSAQLNDLLELLLTPEERNALGLRVELVADLLKGERTQRQISSDLSISIAKITRGSNALKSISPALLKFLQNELL